MGVLLMLVTILGLMAAVFLIIASSIKQVYPLTKFIFGAAAIWLSIYFVLLFFTSFTSKEKTLALNEPKEFCGFYLDCHLHAVVTNVRQTKTVNQKTAEGNFYIVTVKVFSNAKQATLGLTAPRVRVVDATGKTFERSTDAEQELAGNSIKFDKQVGPQGDYFVKEIVFDLPNDMKNPKLEFTEGYAIDRVLEMFLIGDEDSMFHKPTRLSLEQQTGRTSIQ
jgi:hypothetical protein